MDGSNSKRSRNTGAVRLRIEALLDPSKTAVEIADAVGSSHYYVSDVARLNGIKLRADHQENQRNGSWNERNVELLRKLWLDDGLSAGQIALVLGQGFTRNAVISKINRKGWLGRRDGVQKVKRVANPLGARKPKTRPAAPGVSRPIAPKFAPDYVPPPPSEYDVARKTLQQLDTGECHWPTGHVGEPGFGFCALEAVPGMPYCPDHCRRAYQSTPTRAGQKAPANDREAVDA